jgi:Zn-dependent peptidase ImmA (M78 family)/DNA-binding XRE family transcriptional regulator
MPIEIAAKKVGVSVEKLTEWERGESQPTIRQVRSLANALKKPFASFFLTSPPDTSLKVPHDYRRVAGVEDSLTTEILLCIQDSWQRREIVLELLRKARAQPNSIALSLRQSDDPERVGESIRSLLAISVEEQVNWRKAIETVGILIFQAGKFEVSIFRGFSLAIQPLPVIVINRKDADVGRIFTLLHEVCHILLNNDGLCDLSTENQSRTDRAIEIFCNASAAACLMPAEHLLGHQIISSQPRQRRWPEAQIKQLARCYSVSREAILRRLLTLDCTTQDYYEEKREQYEEEGRRIEKKKQKEQKGFLPPPQDALSKLGRPFVSLVLDSYGAERITSSDASDYLGLKLKHFPTLIDSLGGG